MGGSHFPRKEIRDIRRKNGPEVEWPLGKENPIFVAIEIPTTITLEFRSVYLKSINSARLLISSVRLSLVGRILLSSAPHYIWALLFGKIKSNTMTLWKIGKRIAFKVKKKAWAKRNTFSFDSYAKT